MSSDADGRPPGMSTPTPPLLLRTEPFAEPTDLDLPTDVTVVESHHHDATLADLPGIFDAGYSVLAGLGPIGPGYAIYDGDPATRFDLTIGFPVAEAPASVPDGVEVATFPSGPARVVSHLGGFEGLGPAWERFLGTPGPEGGPRRIVEIYVSGPSVTAPEDLRTDLVVPRA